MFSNAILFAALTGVTLVGGSSVYPNVPSYVPGGPWTFQHPSTRSKICHVTNPGYQNDSAPYIIEAFDKCGRNGVVIFDNSTYYVNSVMNIQGLHNVEVDVRGTLIWSTDFEYWLSHSIQIGFQNQSSAFFFGGSEVYWHGNGYGTFDGQGQAWYSAFGSHNNYPGRPHQITFYGLNNSIIEGMRFVQSQMWTMALLYSHNNLLQDIYVNSTWLDGGDGEALRLNQNTDGADTIFSSNIAFLRWTVDNGDDAISAKTNSTNILVQDCNFYRGLGIALGSIGQYLGQEEDIINFRVQTLTVHNAPHAAYLKYWGYIPGTQPIGSSGGGVGHVQQFSMENVVLDNVQQLISVNCYGYFNTSACGNTGIQVSDMTVKNIVGTLTTAVVADLECSSMTPCRNVTIENMSARTNGTAEYVCQNVEGTEGFECSS